MSPETSFQPHDNAQWVADFLACAHEAPSTANPQSVDKQIKCWGFPEFSPQNRDEYLGFFNYLGDVFAQMEFRIEQCLADMSQVLVKFHVQGIHHEEFMGLPATGCLLSFQARALFRLENRVIKEVWMYNKNVCLKTDKGTVYQLQDYT